MGDSNSDGGTSVNKTVRWTVFSEGREARAEQGQIAKQYASPMAHQTKKLPLHNVQKQPNKIIISHGIYTCKEKFSKSQKFLPFP